MKIEDMWLSYKSIIPADAPEIQILETKRAFYGAIHIFSTELMKLDEGMSDDMANSIVDGWQKEIQQFAEDVSNGKQ